MFMENTKELQKVLLTETNGEVIRTILELSTPGPPLLLFRNKLYKRTGSGLTAQFYRESKDFEVAQDTGLTLNSKEFSKPDLLTNLEVVCRDKNRVYVTPKIPNSPATATDLIRRAV